jgi:hypothetical protein
MITISVLNGVYTKSIIIDTEVIDISKIRNYRIEDDLLSFSANSKNYTIKINPTKTKTIDEMLSRAQTSHN